MAMLCFKNGSLCRESVRNIYADKNWDTFNDLLKQSVPGNSGKMTFYFLESEITPTFNRTGIFRFEENLNEVKTPFSPAEEVRAVIEWQCLSLRVHAESLNVKTSRILTTGGASQNIEILQILSNVFGCQVFVSSAGPNTASLGAAFRALHGYECFRTQSFIPFASIIESDLLQAVCTPDADLYKRYSEMIPRFRSLESRILNDV
jgi:xylulokinase